MPTMRKRRKKHWSKSVGGYGYRVRIIERDGGRLSLRWWSPERKDFVSRALGHQDRDRAEVEAKAVMGALVSSGEQQRQGKVTVGTLLGRYERDVIPKRKTEAGRREARRRVNMWQSVLGATRDVGAIDETDLDRFVAQRQAGTITLDDHELSATPGPRTIGADLEFLRAVLNWGRRVKGLDGKPLVRDNPVTIYAIPTSSAPKRPVVTFDRFLAVRVHCDGVDAQRLFGCFLDLVEALGWRESAICQLWASDVDRKRTDLAPHGRLRKRWQTDKEGVEMWVPIGADARTSLDTIFERNPVVGDAPLFPSPRRPGRPWTRWHARDLLERSEVKAELEPIDGGAFHPYRRKWATERKHLPVRDVADAGGWKAPETLERCYYQPDQATMLAVVTEPRKLRDSGVTGTATGTGS